MAIAFNSAVDGGNNGNSTDNHTFSFNNVAGNCIFVGFCGDVTGGADDVSSVTYNGVPLSLIRKSAGVGYRNTYLYGLSGGTVATGPNTVAIVCASVHYILAGAVSYSGVSSSIPDNSNNTVDSSTDTSWTSSLTPVADNCWLTLIENNYEAGNPPAAGTGSTRRTYDATWGTWGLFDNNAAISPAASTSMTTTRSATPDWPIAHGIASFAPSVADNVYRFQPGVVLQATKRGAFF